MNRVLFLFLFYSVIQISAQNIDSLWKVYKLPTNKDTTKLNALSKLIKAYRFSNLDSAITLAQLEIKQANQKQLTQQEANGHRLLGVLFHDKSNFVEAIPHYQYAFELYSELNDNDGKALSELNLTNSYIQLSNYPKALSHAIESLKFFELTKNENQIAKTNINLGIIYINLKQYEKAEIYFSKALKQLIIKENISHLSEVYNNIGVLKSKCNKPKEALVNYKKALVYNIKQSDNDGIAGTYNNIATCFDENKDSALYYLEKALEINKTYTNLELLLTSYINIAVLKNDLGKYHEAIVLAHKADSVAQTINVISGQCDAKIELAIAYECIHDYPQALKYRKEFEILNDSIYNIENSKELSDLKTNYEVEQKEKELKEKANKKQIQLLWLLSVIALIVVFVGLIYYYKYKQKQIKNQLEKNELKQKLLLTQMNPHFIFNSVTHIQGLIDNNQNKEAVIYLNGFSALTRQILQNSTQSYISLADEINMLKNYLNIQQQLHNHSFNFTVYIDETINQEHYFIPPMLLQPFIENSIKHGIDTTAKKGIITISIKLNKSVLIAEIADNGNGFLKNENELKNQQHQSMSVGITQQRLINYEQTKNKKIVFENILNNTNQIIGAKVLFEIPYLYENE